MSTVELTSENFDQIVADDKFVLIDFWASWCGPCRQFAPVYEKSSEQHEDITFASVNTEEQIELASQFDVRSIPTLAIIRDKVLLYSSPGALPETALEDLIQQAKGLDMDEVRAHAEAEHAKTAETSETIAETTETENQRPSDTAGDL